MFFNDWKFQRNKERNFPIPINSKLKFYGIHEWCKNGWILIAWILEMTLINK